MHEDKRIPVMDEADVRREVARMAREIVERNGGIEHLVLMGVHRRGTQIGQLIREAIEKDTRAHAASGSTVRRSTPSLPSSSGT